MTPLLHTKSGAAKRLGVSPDVLHRLVLRGELATVAIGGDARIPDDELVEWVQRNKRVCLYDDAQDAPASGRSTCEMPGSGDATSAAAKRKRSSKSDCSAQAYRVAAHLEQRLATAYRGTGPNMALESAAELRKRLTLLTGSTPLDQTPD